MNCAGRTPPSQQNTRALCPQISLTIAQASMFLAWATLDFPQGIIAGEWVRLRLPQAPHLAIRTIPSGLAHPLPRLLVLLLLCSQAKCHCAQPCRQHGRLSDALPPLRQQVCRHDRRPKCVGRSASCSQRMGRCRRRLPLTQRLASRSAMSLPACVRASRSIWAAPLL